MPTPLPEPRPEVGQRRPDAEDLIAAVEEAMATRPTAYRDDTPVPAVGSTPPVAQPGRPPMSQAATDASGLMIAAGVGSLGVGGALSMVLFASGYADPVVVALIGGAPVALVVALARLAKRARPEPEVHHHYAGPVVHDHREVTNNNRWWSKSNSSN
ncbi:hypothetical protein [Streptomyces sp. 184]|uniref:hypothetical protein n=1 Tax=Streptomyces sp. 184 TaxID=1827526 RepID=UPI003891FDE3